MNNQRIVDEFVRREVIYCVSSLVSALLEHGGKIGDYDYEDFLDLVRTAEDDDEVFEHWIVTPWFAEKLREKGEVVGEIFDFWVWGRTCTGQAIHMDSVVKAIAKDLGITPCT